MGSAAYTFRKASTCSYRYRRVLRTLSNDRLHGPVRTSLTRRGKFGMRTVGEDTRLQSCIATPWIEGRSPRSLTVASLPGTWIIRSIATLPDGRVSAGNKNGRLGRTRRPLSVGWVKTYRTFWTAGSSNPMRIAMIPAFITSTSVIISAFLQLSFQPYRPYVI